MKIINHQFINEPFFILLWAWIKPMKSLKIIIFKYNCLIFYIKKSHYETNRYFFNNNISIHTG